MTDSVNETLVGAEYGDHSFYEWSYVGCGPDGVAYQAKQNTDHALVELRFLNASHRQPESIEKLRKRIRLLDLCGTGCIRRVVCDRLDATPPFVALESPLDRTGGEYSLFDVIRQQLPADRLQIARQLIAMLRLAYRMGLRLSRFSEADVIVGTNGFIRADLTGLIVDDRGDSSSGELATSTSEGELPDDQPRSLRNTLVGLLLSEQADLSAMSGRQRAGLKSMLRDEAAQFTLAQWEQAVGSTRLAPVPNDPHVTVAEMPVAACEDSVSTDQQNLTDADDGDTTAALAPLRSTRLGEGRSQGTDAEEQLTAEFDGTRLELPFHPGSMIGRYQLVKKLGQGGMGIVFQAKDLADHSDVAIKVLWSLSRDSSQALRRFRKEARILAGVQNDHVTRLIEVGEDNGIHYLVMEYVAGTNLRHWLASHGPLDEQTALAVIADIARALVEAHSQGIVHRDIKPENILLEGDEAGAQGLLGYRIKLSDFGIARKIDQSASMAVTSAGTMVGTPRYMSPEQCRGSNEVGPATDVYALGITLFELLTGAPPYHAEDAIAISQMHCYDPIPAVQKKVSSVSDLTAELVTKALAKSPADRFADAGQFVTAVQRVLLGEATAFELHPKLPAHKATKVWEKLFTWDLESSPDSLWPYVSNTERLNRAIGLPPVSYRTENDPTRGLRRFGSFRLGMVTVAWEEHPFEWVEGRKMGVLREFEGGPFKWFLSTVELKPRAGGGTRLEHRLRVEPRNLFGRVLSSIEADWKTGKNLDRVYHRIDRSIQGQLQTHHRDAFEPSVPLAKGQQERMAQRCDRLADYGFTADLIAAFRDYLEQAPPQSMAQIRPVALASTLGAATEEVLKLCLRAASEKLLLLKWEILCPTCRVASASERLLSAIKEHTHCAACDYNFRSDLGEAIELVFRAHPEIRDVDDTVYCIGGPQHSPHVVAQIRLEAGERLELPLKLITGDYLIRGQRLIAQERVRVRAELAPTSLDLAVSELGRHGNKQVLRAGNVILRLANDSKSALVMRVERMIPREDVVTATHVSTLPLFRDLFPDQVIDRERPIDAEELILIATAVPDLDAMYERFSDRTAYELLCRQQSLTTDCITARRGAVVKSTEEGLLAVFLDAEQAVQAALEVQQAIIADARLEGMKVSTVIHRGRVLMANVNQRLDYFGATCRTATSLLASCQGDLLITEAVFADPVIQRLLQTHSGPELIETITLPRKEPCLVQRVLTESRPSRVEQ